jgi:adenylate kinase
MIILFMGVQASGKGTQAKIIAEKKGLVHISTGDLVRGASGELKKKMDEYMAKGALVPDELILELLKERMKQPDCKKGIILDGYPRNLAQAEALEKMTKIDKIFEITVSDETAKKRLMGRWNCKKCGQIYNVVTAPKPKNDHICDSCNLPLSQRGDDIDEKAIQKRLDIYHEETSPILEKFSNKVIKINGEQAIEKITEDLLKKL